MHTSTGWEWLSWTNWLRLQQQTLITPELTRAPVGVSSDDVGPHAFCVALMKHQGWPSLCCPIRPLYRHSRGVSCDYCTQLAKNTLGILCFHLLSVLLKVNKGLAYPGHHVCGFLEGQESQHMHVIDHRWLYHSGAVKNSNQDLFRERGLRFTCLHTFIRSLDIRDVCSHTSLCKLICREYVHTCVCTAFVQRLSCFRHEKTNSNQILSALQ